MGGIICFLHSTISRFRVFIFKKSYGLRIFYPLIVYFLRISDRQMLLLELSDMVSLFSDVINSF